MLCDLYIQPWTDIPFFIRNPEIPSLYTGISLNSKKHWSRASIRMYCGQQKGGPEEAIKMFQNGNYSWSVQDVLHAALTSVHAHFHVHTSCIQLSKPALCWSQGTKSHGFSVISVNSPWDWLSWSEKDVTPRCGFNPLTSGSIYIQVGLNDPCWVPSNWKYSLSLWITHSLPQVWVVLI